MACDSAAARTACVTSSTAGACADYSSAQSTASRLVRGAQCARMKTAGLTFAPLQARSTPPPLHSGAARNRPNDRFSPDTRPPASCNEACAGPGSATNLVDPASSHMLVSKIKPCMSQYTFLYCKTANGSLKQL